MTKKLVSLIVMFNLLCYMFYIEHNLVYAADVELGLEASWNKEDAVILSKISKLEAKSVKDGVKTNNNDITLLKFRTLLKSLYYNVVWVENSNLISMRKKDTIEWRYGYYESVEPYREYEIMYVNGIKTSMTRYNGRNHDVLIEWRLVDYESIFPYKEYERKYINGVKTSETRYTGNNKTSFVFIEDILIANKTYSLPKSFNPGESSAARKAFNIMQAGANLEGLNIYISSGFRTYDYQFNTYNRYVKIYGQSYADTFSSRPGHSEHQTGLAFDLNTIDDPFAYTKEGKWVENNCYKYGFIIRYPKGKEEKTGYQYEPWHIRYLGIDMATKVYNSGLCLEEYFEITSSYNKTIVANND